MTVDYTDLGARLKKIREQNKLTQTDLAASVEMSVQHISNIENARSTLSVNTLVSIANALNCTSDDLLCGSLNTARAVYQNDIEAIIENFTDVEVRALPELLKYYGNLSKMIQDNIEKNKE